MVEGDRKTLYSKELIKNILIINLVAKTRKEEYMNKNLGSPKKYLTKNFEK